MKKLLVTLLLVLLATTTWATAGSLEDRLKTTEIQLALNTNGIPLEDFLSYLSEQSGIRIIAVPEIANINVDLQLTAQQTLGQILEALKQNYQLTFQTNNNMNTVILLKAPYYEEQWLAFSPSDSSMFSSIAKTGAARMEYAPAPVAYYNPSVSFNTEEYKPISDNSFQDTLKTSLSTFSIDVDTASYSNLRRFINTGTLPPPDAIRTEEMLNYFNYDYPQPTEEHPFSVTTEISECPWTPGHKLMLIGLQGKNIQTEDMPPSNLVFLIDVSGSMGEPNKLPLLKTAFKMLIKQLRAQDKVSIVVYAGAAGIVLEPTSGNEKNKIINAIENLQAGGSTAGGEGLRLAYKLAKENFVESGNNRVLLATDGDFNVGVSSEGELTRMIEERRDDGIFLSVLGFGMGNIKDNKMEALADKGNGNYAYIDNALEAKKVLVGQMAGTLYTIAKDVKLQLEFNPGKVKYYRLIGYENRVLENSDFNNDKKDAGDMGAGHSVTALYEIILADSEETIGSIDPLIYQRPEIVQSDDLLQIKVRYKNPADDTSMLFNRHINSSDMTSTPSENFRFAAAVCEYSLLLHNSEFKGQASYNQVLEMAKRAKGEDREGYRAEFVRMVEIDQFLHEK